MKYKARPGIVKTQICGQDVLIPTRQASDACKTVLPLPKLWAATWDAVTTDFPLEKSVQIHMLFTRKSEEEVRKRIDDFCKSLYRQGFLMEVPEEDSPETSEPEEMK